MRRENDTLAKQKPRQICRAKDTKFKTPPRWRLSQLVAGRFGCIRFLSRIRLSELTERRRAQKLRRKTRHSGRSKGERGGGANVRASGYGVFAEVPRGGAFGHRRTKPSELKIRTVSRGLSPRKTFFKHQKHFANRGARYSGMFTKAPSFLRLRSENRIANFGFLELT